MKSDPNLDVELDSDVVEVGAAVTGRIQRWPSDGDDNSKKLGKVQAVRVKVSWRTEGRGDRAKATVGEVNIPAAEFGQASGVFTIPIPSNAPISYDGSLIRVIWQVEARTDRKLAIDPRNNLPLLVVPRNGRGRYRRPHPLRQPDLSQPPADRPSFDQRHDNNISDSNISDGNISDGNISDGNVEVSGPFTGQPVGGQTDQPADSQPRDPFADRPDYLDDPSTDG